MRIPALLLTVTLLFPFSALAAEESALWDALRSGEAVAMMRHALAPGTGDPANFEIDDCSTQRNLSEEGRRQARAIGERFRQAGIESAEVYSSQWCRCRETAVGLALGEVEDLTHLNSFFAQRERRDAQTQALARWLSERQPGAPLVLVTHQVNITALTGVYPRSGEIVVFRWEEGQARVLGSL
jgi:broad specificity phosphatase PhoE